MLGFKWRYIGMSGNEDNIVSSGILYGSKYKMDVLGNMCSSEEIVGRFFISSRGIGS